MAAVSSPGRIYLSTDAGLTWVEQSNAPYANWTSVTIASPGDQHIIATDDSGQIWQSFNGGNTWSNSNTPPGPSNQWSISTGNENLLVAAANPGLLYISTDGGQTWVPQTSLGNQAWSSAAVSADGSKIVATVENGSIYTYENGVWTEQTNAGQRVWSTVAVSADGQVIVAGVDGGPIYISYDGGVTWQPDYSAGNSQNWSSITLNDDGTLGMAATDGGYLYQINLSSTRPPTLHPTTAPFYPCPKVKLVSKYKPHVVKEGSTIQLGYIIYHPSAAAKHATTTTANLTLDITLPEFVNVGKVSVIDYPAKKQIIISDALVNDNVVSVVNLDVDGQKKTVVLVMVQVDACYTKYANTNRLSVNARLSAYNYSHQCVHAAKTIKVGRVVRKAYLVGIGREGDEI